MTDIPDEAVEAVEAVLIGAGVDLYDNARDLARLVTRAAAPHIAAQATKDVRAERDSILRRIGRLESDESWWVGGAWGDYGEAVIPLRALSTLTGPLADAGPEWETKPGFAATWGDLRATVERQEAEFTDLRAGIAALRDEWRIRPGADYLHDHADALDALLREGA